MCCKTFSNCTHGSDPRRVWNTAEYKCAQEALLKGVFPKGATEQPMHLNRSKTRKINRNSLRNFLLHGFSKHPHRFRCSGKGKHLNPAARQNPAAKPLTTNVLQEFQQLCPWFRSQTGLEHHRMQIRHGGTSERGIPERCNRTAQASEPEQNPKNSLQLVDRLSVVRFQQASPPVQMQWKRGVSEPCGKAESGSQPAHNKYIAEFSATVSEVQIPAGFGMSQIAYMPRRHF